MEDEMTNNWGADLVLLNGKISGRQNTFHNFDAQIRTSVPGFCLDKLVASGSDANEYAIDKLTGKDWTTLLVGMGSYVGGTENLQPYSSSGFSSHGQLIFPKPPNHDGIMTVACKRQTIALPYHVPTDDGGSDNELLALEQKCLCALHRKLLTAQLAGKPFKVLLIEYILGGSGGELTERFLLGLAPLLTKFHINVIADEILTTGRVGPSMTITTGLPSAFSALVKCITAGKFTGCGVVLKQASRKPLSQMENFRGTTTHFPIGKACNYWAATMDHLNADAAMMRQNHVLKLMNVNHDESQHWGRGCLIFTSKARPGVTRGLKNRLLPMLEPMKIRKLSSTRTLWTRSTVSDRLTSTAHLWIGQMEEMDKQEHPFVVELVEYIRSKKAPTFRFVDEDLFAFVGEVKGNMMALGYCQRHSLSSQKQFKTYIREATRKAASNGPVCQATGILGIFRSRKGKKRVTAVDVDKTVLGYALV